MRKTSKDWYNFIKVYSNFIPSTFCDEVTNYTANDPNWKRHGWTNYNTDQASHRDNDCEVLNPDWIKEEYYKELRRHTRQAIREYFPEMYVGAHKLGELRLNRYNIGTCMKFHVDNIRGLFDGKKKGVPILSIVGCLDDDYEGGEMIFNNEHEVRLNKGDIVIFPSNFMFGHSVNTIIKGRRVSFVSWGY